MKKRSLFFFFTVMFAIASVVNAQTISFDRPGAGDGTGVVFKRHANLEMGLNFTKYKAASSNTIPGVLLRYGLLNKLEIRVGQSYLMNAIDMPAGKIKDAGLSNLSIGAKYALCQKEEKGMESAILFDAVLPTGSKDVASDKADFVLKYLHTAALNDKWSLGSNLGLSLIAQEDINLVYAFAFGYTINDQWGVFAEPYGEWTRFEDFEVAADAGITYLINPKMQADLSFGTGLTQNFSFISFGFAWAIGK